MSGRRFRSRHSAGFSLIELMVAMLLGLIVIGGVTSVFLANQRTYRTNQALSDVQNGSRVAFELMARDIRNAGLTGCNNNGRVANVLNNPGSAWWANWGNALVGYTGAQTDPATGGFGTGASQRIAGTDSIMLIGAADSGLSVAQDNEPAANFKLNETTSDLKQGDVIIVCDIDHATIVQISNYNNNNVTLVHDTGNVVSPGNCSKGLGFPTVCTTNGNLYTFGPNSQIAKLNASDWYVGANGAGGRSLYRVNVSADTGTPTATAQEMVRDVTNMQIQYHQNTRADFINADAVTNWSQVDAARVTLTIQSVNKTVGTDAKPVQRTFVSTTTVRNRVN